jgi:hypothetical protein
MRIVRLLSIIVTTVLVSNVLAQVNTATIRGFVNEKNTGEPVMFANIYLLGTRFGAATDVNGLYVISQIPAGKYTLMATRLGFDTLSYEISIKAGEILTKKILMTESAQMIEGVNISAERQEARTETRTSVINITPKQIRQIPTIGGQADLAQYLQVLPGVIFTGDQGGQLYIRGGSPIQNKVLLDGMIIYNPFHSIGLFSVFETDILRNAEVYTGGFGAEYGGRISSIMDITTREGNKRRLAGKVSTSTFGANLLLEGPLKKEKDENSSSSSFIFSAKNSYLKESSRLFYNYIDTAGLPFNYTDFYGKVSFNTPTGSRINFFGFNYSDFVNYREISDYHWNTFGFGSNFVLVPAASSTIIDGHFAYSDYRIALESADAKPRESEINGFSMGMNFTYFLGKDQVTYGLEMSGTTTEFKFVNPVDRIIKATEYSTELAGFIKYKKTWGKLLFEPGFRMQFYATEFSPEPRLAMKLLINDRMRAKMAGGFYSQNIISTTYDRDVVNLFYGFITGPDNLQKKFDGKEVMHNLQKSQHIIAGLEYDLGKRITLNIEGYYKYFSQLTGMNRNKVFDDIPEYYDKPDYLKKDFVIETGDAKGIDFVLKYDYRKLYIWAVYSLGFINRYDGVIEYVPHYDRRHNVNLVGSYEFGKNFQYGVDIRWNYGSGFPFTQNQGFYPKVLFDQVYADYLTQNESLGIIYAGLNEGRLSDYHRLDFSFKRKWVIGANSSLEANFSLTNIYNRKNVFYFDRVTQHRVDQLPLMPSIGLNFRF